MLDTYSPSWMTEDLEIFKDAVNKFYTREFAPHSDRWTKQGSVDRDAWYKAGQAGILCASIPEEYGGQGFGLSEQCIVLEEMGRSLLCAPYFSSAVLTANAILYGASEEYKKKYLI